MTSFTNIVSLLESEVNISLVLIYISKRNVTQFTRLLDGDSNANDTDYLRFAKQNASNCTPVYTCASTISSVLFC